jgi:uncharacterized protein with ParB-like and HNH nuclease domain
MPDDVDSVSAHSSTLSTLLDGAHRFEVPDYQRQYSWEEEQLEKLWNDIQNIDMQNDTHFLGSILLVNRDTNINERDVNEVVDGQQRLATISILFATIREQLRDKDDVPDSTVQAINEYLIDKDSRGNEKPNLKLNELDNDTFQKILDGKKVSNKESKLWQAAQYYTDKVEQMSISDIEDIREKVLKAMPIVVIETDDKESAFILFETLNERGLELSNVDLMKNSLLKISDINNVDYDFVRVNWENTVSELRYDVDNYEKFFQYYLMFTPILNINEAISDRTVLDHFEEVLENIDHYDISGIEDLSEDIYQKATTYRNIVNANISGYTDEANKKINEILSRLENFGSDRQRILSLYVLTQIGNESDIIRALLLIESYNVQTVLVDDESGATVLDFFCNTCSTMAQSDYPVDILRSELDNRAPSDDKFKQAIIEKNFSHNDRTRYILRRYEQVSMNGSQEDHGEIEHIAPRSAFSAKKYTNWTTYLNVGKDEFEEFKDRLGNLALMETRLNIKAGNSPFSEKKKKYKQSDFEMAQSIDQYTEWSKDKIQSRTKRLAQEAPNIWNLDH